MGVYCVSRKRMFKPLIFLSSIFLASSRGQERGEERGVCLGSICAGGGKACVGSICAGGGAEKVTRICSRTCINERKNQCAVIARRDCELKCRKSRVVPRAPVQWTADLCGLVIKQGSPIPTITITNWMSLIQSFSFINKAMLCKAERAARNTPGKLIRIVQTFFHNWCDRNPNCEDTVEKKTLKTIIFKINQFIMTQKKVTPTTPFISITAKINTWMNEIRRIAQLSNMKHIFQKAIAIVSGAGSSLDILPILTEIQRIFEIQKLEIRIKEKLQILLLDMKYNIMREKISYLLTTYDRVISNEVKVKLSQLIMLEDALTEFSKLKYKEMLDQYQLITKYVTTLIQKRYLKGQVFSELKMLCGKLRVDGFGNTVFNVHNIIKSIPGITMVRIIQELTSRSVVSFRVHRVEPCHESLCDRSILDGVCMYGGQCHVAWEQGTCTIRVTRCRREATVKQISTEKVVSLLQAKHFAQTITYSMVACKEICNIASKAFPFGGIQCKISWSPSTKMCTLQIIGRNQATQRQFHQLEYLSFQQVAQRAVNQEVLLKCPDENKCRDYCDNQIIGASNCQGDYQCFHRSECWGGQCTCKIKHTCTTRTRQSNFGMNRIGGGSGEIKSEDDVEEVSVTIPKVEPVISQGSKRKKKKPKEKTTGNIEIDQENIEKANEINGFPQNLEYH